MNSSGRLPAGSITPIPFPSFSPSLSVGSSVGTLPASGVASGSNMLDSGRGQSSPLVAGTPQSGAHGTAAGRGSPLPPRPLSSGKTASLGLSRFTAALSPVLETPPGPPLQTAAVQSPPPSASAGGPSGAPNAAPSSTPASVPAATPIPGPTPTGTPAAKSSRKAGRQTAQAGSSPGQAASTVVRTAEVAPAPRRKKRKPVDKQIPERVAASVPESAIYNQLVELEKRVDATLARKKLDIQEALRSPPRVPRTLRIYVSCSHENQGSGAPQVDVPSWTLSISGRVLEDDTASQSRESNGAEAGKSAVDAEIPIFSTFLRRLTVGLDPALYPEKPIVSWDAARALTPIAGFEIKRAGKTEFVARIQIELNYVPQKYQLSAKLAQLLGLALETRPRITAALWQYIKANKLQVATDPTVITCDSALQEIFGEPRIKMSLIAGKLQAHLTLPSPITIEYPIKLSSQPSQVESCYDVAVDLPMSLQKEMSDCLASLERHRDIATLDDLIARDVRQINEHRKRRAFFLGFSGSPVDFIYGLMASQRRDLRQAAPSPSSSNMSMSMAMQRHSALYSQPWVEDAVLRYLNRRPAAGIE